MLIQHKHIPQEPLHPSPHSREHWVLDEKPEFPKQKFHYKATNVLIKNNKQTFCRREVCSSKWSSIATMLCARYCCSGSSNVASSTSEYKGIKLTLTLLIFKITLLDCQVIKVMMKRETTIIFCIRNVIWNFTALYIDFLSS